MDSSLGGHFWVGKSPILTGLARVAQKRETGSIESGGDLRGGQGISGSER